MYIVDIGNACCYYASVGLVPHGSPKLGLSYLKLEARGAISSLVTRTHVRVQERPRGFGEAVATSVVGEAVCACERQCFGLW
jgi:hypothetical protein